MNNDTDYAVPVLEPDWSELGLETERFPSVPEDWAESGFAFRYTATGWQDQAVCAQIGGDAFFPEEGGGAAGQVAKAKKVCAGCPVRETCLDWALASGLNEPGVWGGLTEHERRPLRRARPCGRDGCNNPRGFGVDGSRLRYCSDQCHALARIAKRRAAA